VKLSKRILFVIPFLIAAFFFLSKILSSSDCSGLLDLFSYVFQFLFCFVTFIIALKGATRKLKDEKIFIEPITGIITFSTLIVLFFAIIYPNLFKSPIYLIAENEEYSRFPNGQRLEFRKNGKVEVHEEEADFSCFETFSYLQKKDTILIINKIIENKHGIIANKFLIQGQKLIPLTPSNLIDTSKRSLRFAIVTKR